MTNIVSIYAIDAQESQETKVQILTNEETEEYYRRRSGQILTTEKVQILTTATKDRYSIPRRDEPVPQPASSLPERYFVSRPPATRGIPVAPDQSPLADDQTKVQNLTTNVHQSGQILDFEPSLKQPAEPAVREPENKVSPKNDPAAETAIPSEKPKPIYVPVKYEVALPPAELVPVRESERYSRTRTR